MTRDGSRSQFNSSNYMPLKFGLRSGCMVCAFWKQRRVTLSVSGARESAENVGWFLAASEEPLCFTSISPHAGLCLSLPHCVVFFRGFGGL